MTVSTIALLLAGLGVLVAGAELLVRGAASLAAAARISPLVIGLTVVAYGTSAPEMAVSIMAARAGQADIALGNVVGSNIFNVLFILGISALIAPLVVSRQLVRLDVPVMIGISALLWLMALDGAIGLVEGGLLLAGAIAYTGILLRQGRADPTSAADAATRPAHGPVAAVALVLVGLALLVLGSRWLVGSAVTIARVFGVDELVIGLTLIAAGTSLPELATSVLAALRGQRDIAVGNVVGSNIFNILAILGVGALSSGGLVVSPAALAFDIPVMTAVALACLPVFVTGHAIARWEGVVFLAYYVAYTVYLILYATSHAMAEAFGAVMLVFVIPLTVLGLLLSWRRGGAVQEGPPGADHD